MVSVGILKKYKMRSLLITVSELFFASNPMVLRLSSTLILARHRSESKESLMTFRKPKVDLAFFCAY